MTDEMPGGLPHRIGGSLKPIRALRSLFSREHLDESVGEHVESIRLRDVAIERCRVELCQDEDAFQPCMQTVADRNVDQSIFPTERHGRFRSHMRERKQPGSAAATEDQREDVVHASILIVPPHPAI